MITRSIAKRGTYTALMPFQSHEDWLRTAANIRRFGELAERVKQLEKKLVALNVKPKKAVRIKESHDRVKPHEHGYP